MVVYYDLSDKLYLKQFVSEFVYQIVDFDKTKHF
jgi:hypothetical protein